MHLTVSNRNPDSDLTKQVGFFVVVVFLFVFCSFVFNYNKPGGKVSRAGTGLHSV